MSAQFAYKTAQFDRASQARRSMLAKIQIARKDLRMEEDDYRQIVFDKTGRTSLKEASEADLHQVLSVMKSKGFRALPKSGSAPAAQHPVARKARALWISLYHLGVVHNPAEAALEAFACKQLSCERMVWARQSDGFKLIEALKDMARRSGWRLADRTTGKPLNVLGLQMSLCAALMDKLRDAKAIPGDWTLNTACDRLAGFAPETAWTADSYQRAAMVLGKHLREAGVRS